MSDEYDDRTVDELRDELRDRDLKVSGSKDELVQRLEEDDQEARDSGGEDRADDGASGASPGLREVIDRIRRELAEVTGLQVESASGLQRGEGGWTARVEVVELTRVPRTTDVLATYEVHADGDGAITAFDRVRRYRRSEAE